MENVTDGSQLVQSLIEMAQDLPHRDNIKLYALRRRTEMIIRNVFGESSPYLTNLARISFSPSVVPVLERTYDERWQSGKAQIINLLNTMLEELTLFGASSQSKETPRDWSQFGKAVFVVHGHDEAMKQAVSRTRKTESRTNHN